MRFLPPWRDLYPATAPRFPRGIPGRLACGSVEGTPAMASTFKRSFISMTTTKTSSTRDTLNRYLSCNNRDDIKGIAVYIDGGSELVTAEAIASLRSLRKSLREKIADLTESARLRSRLELLATVFDETCRDVRIGSRAQREIAFALLYFLKGVDRIPDSVPEIGLLDDAMVVQIILQRHESAIREHCLRHGRVCAAEL